MMTKPDNTPGPIQTLLLSQKQRLEKLERDFAEAEAKLKRCDYILTRLENASKHVCVGFDVAADNADKSMVIITHKEYPLPSAEYSAKQADRFMRNMQIAKERIQERIEKLCTQLLGGK